MPYVCLSLNEATYAFSLHHIGDSSFRTTDYLKLGFGFWAGKFSSGSSLFLGWNSSGYNRAILIFKTLYNRP